MSNLTGLFDLTGLESMRDDDILNMNINEAGEFVSKCPSTNRPDDTFDSDSTAAKETGVSVPGGLKETPSAKPEGGERGVIIPGGDKESPSVHAVPGASVSNSSKVILSQDTYNDAITALKKSFKEGYDIMEMLENCTVSGKSTMELQNEYTENAIDEAIYNSYCNGPIFEAVEHSDKEEIKKIIETLRPKVEKFASSDNIKFYKPYKIIRLIFNSGTTAVGIVGGTIGTDIYDVAGNTTERGSNWWNTRFWQVLGAICIETANVAEYTKKMSEKFASDLGEYKIIAVRMPETLFDLFRVKFNWKNMRRSYFLLIDKKVPSDIKKSIKELEKIAGSKDSGKREIVAKESVCDYAED